MISWQEIKEKDRTNEWIIIPDYTQDAFRVEIALKPNYKETEDTRKLKIQWQRYGLNYLG